jgi:hypothetical protein
MGRCRPRSSVGGLNERRLKKLQRRRRKQRGLRRKVEPAERHNN